MSERDAQGVATRRAAYRALRRINERAAFSPPVVQGAVAGLPPRERSLAASLIYETLRWRGTLDWALEQVLDRPGDQVDEALRDLLRMAAWQLLYGRMPDRAVVDTAVQLARSEIGERVAGFTNGVLRNLARRRDTLPWPPRDDARGLALATGYPEWIAGQAQRRFGGMAAAELAAGNAAPGVTLRASVSPGQDPAARRDALIDELRALGIDAQPGRWAPETVRAPGADPGSLAAVQEGRATPQDEASTLVGRAVASALAHAGGSGETVADLCAGPGGKSTHLAQLGFTVHAFDVVERRAEAIGELAQRLGVAGQVHSAVADARRPDVPAAGVDAVLLDAPCTGLGVTRRRPEVRWRRDSGDPDRLAALQSELLTAAAELVRPGGVLIYSVCTWTQAETAEVTSAFYAMESDRYRPLAPDVLLPEGCGSRFDGDLGVQLTSDMDGTDGMYLCAFQRLPG